MAEVQAFVLHALLARLARRLPGLGLLLLLAAAPASASEFLVTGQCLYLDRAWNWNGYTGELTERPVRRADVSVLDGNSGRLLGRGTTDADGRFAVSCRSKLARDIVVRVAASTRFQRRFVGPFPRLVVRDAAGAPWVVQSPVFAHHDPVGDLQAGTLLAQPVAYGNVRGNPFNVFDCAVTAFEFVIGPENGAPVRGRVALHWPSWTGSWVWGRRAQIAVDDGDDDAVILHELGHLVHDLYSDNDSPGGPHWFGYSDQDPRLAFGEGYATAFAGQVLAASGQHAVYVDADGASVVGGAQLRLDLETAAPWAAASAGSADEVAVATILFDLFDTEQSVDVQPGVDDDGFTSTTLVNGLTPARAWWAVFTGPVRRAKRLSLSDAWDGWLSVHAEDPHYEALREVYERRSVRFWRDAFEPDHEPGLATPMSAGFTTQWTPEHTLYWSPDEPAECGAGDRDWFVVELLAGQVVRFETRYPQGIADAATQADTFLSVHDPQGIRRAWDDDSGVGRNARVSALLIDQDGAWRIEVRSAKPSLRYGRYELGVTILEGPAAP